MSSFNPFASIHKDKKLEGPNYIDWCKRLDIVLAADKIMFIMTGPRPENPGHAQCRWDEVNQLCKCYILASMNNVLPHTPPSYGNFNLYNREPPRNVREAFKITEDEHAMVNAKHQDGRRLSWPCLENDGNEQQILGHEMTLEA